MIWQTVERLFSQARVGMANTNSQVTCEQAIPRRKGPSELSAGKPSISSD